MLCEFIAIVGESGSGNSTLVRLALGLEEPSSGAVYYDGRGTLINGFPARERSLRGHTTFAGLVDMYRDDKPVLTNLVESDASPMPRPGPARTGRVDPGAEVL